MKRPEKKRLFVFGMNGKLFMCSLHLLVVYWFYLLWHVKRGTIVFNTTLSVMFLDTKVPTLAGLVIDPINFTDYTVKATNVGRTLHITQ